MQAIVEGLTNQRVVRYLPFAGQIFKAGDLIGKHRGDQVFALHALDLRGNLATPGKARQGHGHTRVPAPADTEQRGIEHSLDQHLLGAAAVEVAPHLVESKAVAGRQRQHDGIFTGCRLQLDIEGTAEPLAQGQTPGAVDAATERRMNDQLRAA